MSKVYRRVPSSDLSMIEEAGQYGVADLHEALGVVPGRMALMSPEIRPLNFGLRVSGPAATAYNYPGDGLMVHKAVQLAQPGQILAFANSGNLPSTMFAELVALSALERGVKGVIVDGSIRDVDALREMNFPIWAASIHASHIEKRGPGSLNVPIVCGGVRVEPGDTIVADGDGVICIPRAQLGTAVLGARQRAENEVGIRKRVAEGEVLYDILNIGAGFDAADIEEFDGTWNGDE